MRYYKKNIFKRAFTCALSSTGAERGDYEEEDVYITYLYSTFSQKDRH